MSLCYLGIGTCRGRRSSSCRLEVLGGSLRIFAWQVQGIGRLRPVQVNVVVLWGLACLAGLRSAFVLMRLPASLFCLSGSPVRSAHASCKRTLQECPTMALQEIATRVSCKSVSQDYPTTVSDNTVPQEGPTRVPFKRALQDCPKRVSDKSGPHECSTTMSCKRQESQE